MILVLPYALPAAPVAGELGRRLANVAPTLAGWLAQSPASLQALPAAETLCTPLQAWRLQQAGYAPPSDVPLGAGWTALAAAPSDSTEPVWLADYVHLHVTQQGVVLGDTAVLQVRADEAAQLLEAARPDLADAGITAEPEGATGLRLFLPEGLAPYAPTPAAAIGQEIQEWWSQNPASRPWRRALNAVQMAWYDHPVNLARNRNGLPPINGLWIFGGGRPADFARDRGQQPQTLIDDTLAAPARAGDWQGWLDALAVLETQRFAPLAHSLAQSGAQPLQLVLTGEDRLCTLDVPRVRGLARWLPRRRHDWQQWWAPTAAS